MVQNPYGQDQNRRSHLPHLQKRVYPGMVDQSFDSTQASSQDKYLIQDGQRQPPMNTNAGYGNLFPETSSTPAQQAIDQRYMGQKTTSSNNLMNQGQPSQSSAIDKDLMPRPISNINAYNYRAGIPERFPTKSIETPPSAGIPFIQIDEGQVGPKYMRGTVIQAPLEQNFQTQSNIPFGFIVQPLAEMNQHEYQNEIPDIPLIDYGDEGPFRCHRCKAYVNPNMIFQDGGSKAQCNLCQFVNDVPVNYQSQLNEFGQRRDRLQRPELQFGAYEFKAPAAYFTRKLLNPTYVFVIDVSQFSLPMGFFNQIVQSIKMTLDYIQNPENTQICFITYDVNLHFYNLPQDPNGEPTILWVGEITDPFIPFPKEKLMLNLVQDRERIDIFLDKLINMHNLETKKYQAPFLCTGAAISAAKQLLHEEGGRILVFASNINSVGYGNLLYRDDPKAYNTDKEKTLLSPVNDIFIKLAFECVNQRICVDLIYAINSLKSIDLTSIAPVATITGGDLHLFNPFDINKHGEKLHYEIFRILTRTQGSEIAIKARTSTGLTVTEYFGSFGLKENADFELSAIDSDKSVGFLIRNDEKLKEDSLAFVQFAMMYTTQFGERRIRIFNYSLIISKNLNGYYKAADCETLSQFMVKKEVARIMAKGAKSTREAIINNLVNLLYVYRQKCAAQTQPSQLVLPENLKLLPLYNLTALKNPALKMFPGVRIDDKIYWLFKLLKMPPSQMPYFLYPRIYKVTDIGAPECVLGQYAEGSQLMQKPNCLPACLEKLGSKDAYIVDNSEYIYLYLGNQVDDTFIQNVNLFKSYYQFQVFGYANFSDLKFNGITTFTPLEGSDASQILWQFIEQLRYEKIGVSYAPLRLIYAGDVQEKELIEACLIEDSVDINKEFPYTDFLCMLHKLIRNKTQ